jgi:hypothetical protein
MIKEILQEEIIRREFYLNQIENFLGSKIVKVLVGQRRV